MGTVTVSSVVASVLLWYAMLDGRMAQPVSNRQRLVAPEIPNYAMVQTPMVQNQESSGLPQIRRFAGQQSTHYPLRGPLLQPNRPIAFANGKAHPDANQQLAMFTDGNRYYQPQYQQSTDTSAVSAENDDEDYEDHEHYDQSYQEDFPSERLPSPEKVPEVKRFKNNYQLELEKEYAEENTQTQIPVYDVESLENYFQLVNAEHVEDSTTKYELIPQIRKVIIPSEVSTKTTKKNRTAHYETLLHKPYLLIPLTPKPHTVPIQHRNYQILHEVERPKIVHLESRRYSNPAPHSDLLSNDPNHNAANIPANAARKTGKSRPKPHSSSSKNPDTNTEQNKAENSKTERKNSTSDSDVNI